jgi:predicted nucleic acid-binding protein
MLAATDFFTVEVATWHGLITYYVLVVADVATRSVLTTFVRRVARGNCEAFVGIPVFDEFFYRLLLARIRDATGGHALETLRADRTGAMRTHGPAIDRALRQLVMLPHVHLVGMETADFSRMLDNIETYGLLPRDALHLALMQRLNLTTIASGDTDFDRVSTISRHWVINGPQE